MHKWLHECLRISAFAFVVKRLSTTSALGVRHPPCMSSFAGGLRHKSKGLRHKRNKMHAVSFFFSADRVIDRSAGKASRRSRV